MFHPVKRVGHREYEAFHSLTKLVASLIVQEYMLHPRSSSRHGYQPPSETPADYVVAVHTGLYRQLST